MTRKSSTTKARSRKASPKARIPRTRKVSRPKSTAKKRTTTTRVRRPPPSFIEKLMGSALKRLGIAAVPQYRIARGGRHTGRSYYLDFAVPKSMIAIECDGAAYHSSRRSQIADARRQAECEALGWRFVRFTGSEIVSDMAGCEKVLRALIKGES